MSAVFSRRPWGRNECVTNEPQRTSAGRLDVTEIVLYFQGLKEMKCIEKCQDGQHAVFFFKRNLRKQWSVLVVFNKWWMFIFGNYPASVDTKNNRNLNLPSISCSFSNTTVHRMTSPRRAIVEPKTKHCKVKYVTPFHHLSHNSVFK